MNINGKYYTESEAAAYIQALLRILSDARPVLSMAFFADYHLQHKADAIMFEIDNILKGDRKS
jgi:hypothetical protein